MCGCVCVCACGWDGSGALPNAELVSVSCPTQNGWLIVDRLDRSISQPDPSVRQPRARDREKEMRCR